MKVCALALASSRNKWLDRLDQRLRDLSIVGIALLDFAENPQINSSLTNINAVYSLEEIEAAQQYLEQFDLVLVVSEGYLPSLKLREIPVVPALLSAEQALGLSFRSLDQVSYANKAKAQEGFKLNDTNFIPVVWFNPDINDYPRFDCCCALYRTGKFLDLTLRTISELSGVAEIEAGGARSLRTLEAFFYLTLSEPLCEVEGLIQETLVQSVTQAENPPEISVIVPTKNRAVLLKRALQSILSQTFSNLEIIVINDGGMPPSSDLLGSDARIKYIEHPESRGLAAARNSGLRAATGKYIAYLDDDDNFWPRHLEFLHKAALTSGVSFVYACAARTWFEGDKLIKRDLLYNEPYSLNKMLQGNLMPVLTILHERRLIDQLGMFDEDLSRVEDWDLWLRFALKENFVKIDSITSEYSFPFDGSSMTSMGHAPFWWHEFIVRAKHRECYRKDMELETKLLEVTNRDSSRLLAEVIEQVARNPTDILSALKVRDWGLFRKQFDIIKNAYPENREAWSLLEQMIAIEPTAKKRLADYSSRLLKHQNTSKVSIVLPVFNDVNSTLEVLQSLYKFTDPNNFELIIVGNASTDSGHEFLKEFQQRNSIQIIVNPERQSLAVVCNQGALAAKNDLIVFISNSLVFNVGWLETLIESFRDTSIGIAGFRSLSDADVKLQYLLANSRHSHENVNNNFSFVSGKCLIIRRELYMLLNGMDEIYQEGFGDYDLCLKAGQLGFKVIAQPNGLVHDRNPTRKIEDTQSIVKFFQRWGNIINTGNQFVVVKV